MFLRFWLILGISVLIQLVPVECHTANLLLGENFDSQVLDGRVSIIGHNWAVLAPGQYHLDAVGRGGTGHCLTSGTVNEAYLYWRNPVPGSWPSDELYVSFWMRYPKFITTEPVNENIKIFYPRWDGLNSYVHYSLTQPDIVYYSAMAQGSMVAAGRWLTCPNMTNGKWHSYQYYVNFSQGISRFWYDGSLILDDAYGPGKWTNSVYSISIPSIDAEDPGVFSRQIDEIEVWDGLP